MFSCYLTLGEKHARTFRRTLFCGSQQQTVAGWHNLILTVPWQFHYRPLAYLPADDYVDTICEMPQSPSRPAFVEGLLTKGKGDLVYRC